MKKPSKPPRKFSRRKARPKLIKDQDNDRQRVDTQINEKKHQEMIKQRNSTINALGCFIISIIINCAPQYIETKNVLFVNISQCGSFILLMIGIFIIEHTYPNLFDSEKAICILSTIIAIVFYWVAEPSVAQKVPLAIRQFFRIMSFMALLLTVLMLISNFPRLLDLYEEKKGNIKTLFNIKDISGFILGILTMSTALFQLIQVLLSFIHS